MDYRVNYGTGAVSEIVRDGRAAASALLAEERLNCPGAWLEFYGRPGDVRGSASAPGEWWPVSVLS